MGMSFATTRRLIDCDETKCRKENHPASAGAFGSWFEGGLPPTPIRLEAIAIRLEVIAVETKQEENEERSNMVGRGFPAGLGDESRATCNQPDSPTAPEIIRQTKSIECTKIPWGTGMQNLSFSC